MTSTNRSYFVSQNHVDFRVAGYIAGIAGRIGSKGFGEFFDVLFEAFTLIVEKKPCSGFVPGLGDLDMAMRVNHAVSCPKQKVASHPGAERIGFSERVASSRGDPFGPMRELRPPMVALFKPPCEEQLIAHNRTVDEIRQFIEVDSLAYLSLEELLACMKVSADDCCTACWSGQYKIPVDQPTSKFRVGGVRVFKDSTDRTLMKNDNAVLVARERRVQQLARK